MGSKKPTEEQEQLHQIAVTRKEFWYTDPKTGCKVLTAYFLQTRGYCCKSYCRHCPFGFNDTNEETETNEK